MERYDLSRETHSLDIAHFEKVLGVPPLPPPTD
jgi:hypothetical protein